MKTKLVLVSSFLILSIMGLVFSNFKTSNSGENENARINLQSPPPIPSNNRWLDRFYIGAVDCMYDCQSGYSRLDWLGFNLWHNYLKPDTNEIPPRYTPYVEWFCNGGIPNDKLMPACSTYAGDIITKIDNEICQNKSERKLLMSRPKIDWLCYGQRSDYQCEPIDVSNPLWFYSFNNHETGVTETDNTYGNGAVVRHCRTIPSNPIGDNPGFVVKRLKANTEQCRDIPNGNYGNVWMGDSQCDWYIKPRIRIPVGFPISNPETPVCRITIIGQDGNQILKEVVITGKYFGDATNVYDGYYKEDGFYFPSFDSTLTIEHTPWGDKYMHYARGNQPDDPVDGNKVDIKVYWYGNCDMWIDYVRVDNDVANRLLKPGGDLQFEQWIEDEVTQIGTHTPSGASSPAVMKYYLEYAEFNNLPCIRYVNDKLKQYSNGYIDIMQDFCNTISWHVPEVNRPAIQDADFLSTYYVDRAGYSQIFAECYPFIACHGSTTQGQEFSKLPCTLFPDCNQNYNDVLGKPVPPAE